MSSENTTETHNNWQEKWQERVYAFAQAINASIEEVTTALGPLIGEPGAEALEVLSNEEFTPIEDIRKALESLNVPLGLLRKYVSLLRGTGIPSASKVESAAGMMLEVLPTVPDDDSFIAALKVGGELKIGSTEVIAAVKAFIAKRMGLFELPTALLTKMEEWAEKHDEPCPQSWYDIRKLVVRREYAPVLSVLGLDGHFVSQRRKEQLFRRLESGLWPALARFQEQLKKWHESWLEGASNPGIILAALGGMGKEALPRNMLQPPDTGFLRDAAEEVYNEINACFSGTGIPVARALAYEAQQIRTILSDERLPGSIGATNREQMLKNLAVDVSADDVRLERSLVRFVLSIMELTSLARGKEEVLYFTALLQLGHMIPWEKL